MSRGILTVVSGFSGAGKGTLMKRLMEEYDNYALSISVTTRDPRPGEEDGVSYFFRTEEEFDRMVEEDAFLEYARYVKHSYGTPKAYVEEQLDAGKDVLLEIEIREHFRSRKNVRTPFLCSSHRRPPRSWNDASGDAERKQKKSSKAEWSVQKRKHRAWTSTIMS